MTSLYAGTAVLGLVRGRGRDQLSVEAVTPGFLEAPPQRGEFLLLERSDSEAVAARVVEARGGGPFAEGREAGATYLAELLRMDLQAVPDTVKELLHRLHLDLLVLGVLKLADGQLTFAAGNRALDPFGHRLRRPSPQALQFLASAGQQEGPGVVPFGSFAVGYEVRAEVPVRFSIERLKSRRSFVFARAGYGKSNLVKLLLSRLYEAPPDVGLLILDPEGEYAFAQEAEQPVPGLADHPGLRRRLKVFTQRKSPELARYGDVIVSGLRIDFGSCEPGEILSAFVHPEKLDQVWTNWLRSLGPREKDGSIRVNDRWRRLVAALDQKQYSIGDEELAELLGHRRQRGERDGQKEGNVSYQAIRNNLVPLIRRLHDGDSRLVQQACEWLDRGNIVVMDLSLGSHSDARALADLLLFRIFTDRVRALTEGQRKHGVLAVFEEAQTMLSAREPETSIFVRWVKEGRKYGLGAMMITQQPGAIAPQLVSQGDNFFVMHLLAEDDLRLLQRINAHYTEDLLQAIRSEPVKGNCYFWSAPDQPYVVPCRVDNFDRLAAARVRVAVGRVAGVGVEEGGAADPLGDLVLRVLAVDERVYLMTVRSVGGKPGGDVVAVAADFLRRGLEAAALALREGEVVIPGDLGGVLRGLEVLAVAGEGVVQLRAGEMACWVFDRGRLAAACHRRGHALKPVVDWRVDVRFGGGVKGQP